VVYALEHFSESQQSSGVCRTIGHAITEAECVIRGVL